MPHSRYPLISMVHTFLELGEATSQNLIVYQFEFFWVFLPFIRELEISNGYTIGRRDLGRRKQSNPLPWVGWWATYWRCYWSPAARSAWMTNTATTTGIGALTNPR